MSAARLSGTTPPRLTIPIVDRRPTSAWCDAGPRIESPVSLARPMAAKFAATPAADPPLDPAVTRLVSYGLRVYPGRIELTVSIGLKANSAMFDFAIITA